MTAQSLVAESSRGRREKRVYKSAQFESETNRTPFVAPVGPDIVLSSPNQRKTAGSRASPVINGFIVLARDSGPESLHRKIIFAINVAIDIL